MKSKRRRKRAFEILCSTQVTAFLGSEGKLTGLRCMPTRPGEPDQNGIPWPVIIAGEEPFDLHFDRAIVAIGQTGDTSNIGQARPITPPRAGTSALTAASAPMCPAFMPREMSPKDPLSVVQAMASGREVARAVHFDLSGEKPKSGTATRPATRDFRRFPETLKPWLAPACRKESLPAAMTSALRSPWASTRLRPVRKRQRCLQCGVCSECLQCLETCGLQGAITA